MKKMPCLFERTFHERGKFTMLETVTPGCEWVLREGTATRKRDGTACAVIAGKLFKRYDAKRGKPAPANGIPCDDPDPVTGHWPHWIPVGDEPESKWHCEAWEMARLAEVCADGTYELCGPKLQGNPEKLDHHHFFAHGSEVISPDDFEASFGGLRFYLTEHLIEGIVWHHPDGRMCKLRRHDFGLPWPIRPTESIKP